MFCPRCATQNIDGASFCRACGANIGLIPQALDGKLPKAQPDRYEDRRARRRKLRDEEQKPTIEKGIVSLFMGIGFILAGIAVMMRFPGGFTWGWAMFIPGFSCLGKGVAAIVAARGQQQQLPNTLNSFTGRMPASPQTTPFLGEPRPRDTGQMMPAVPSVTEGTTRHLGTEAAKQHFDSLENQKPS